MKAREDDMAALKEKAKVRRQPGGRKKAYDDEAVEKMAAAPESQVLVPQRATGKVNLAATGAVGMGAAITKEWLAREVQSSCRGPRRGGTRGRYLLPWPWT